MFELWHYLLILAGALVILTFLVVGLIVVPYCRKAKEPLPAPRRDVTWLMSSDSSNDTQFTTSAAGYSYVFPHYYINELSHEIYNNGYSISV